MEIFLKLFVKNKVIIGMIHIGALPGTPGYCGNLNSVISNAIKEAEIYKKCGVDAIAIENMHDIPYLNGKVGPEITAAMSIIGYKIKQTTSLPCGIQILAGANSEAIASAFASGLDFIRAEGFVFSHIADEGLMNSCAGELLRYRKAIGADHIQIFTDIKKKHSSHAITSDVDIAETAHAAEFFKSDGLIVTGIATGSTADVSEIITVKKAVNLPVMIGSGVTIDNVECYLEVADALIVGSYFKVDGIWQNIIDPERVKKFMDKVEKLR
ncbi:BtpA/SgcQ family protein [bacterium]|nr:BtpA/SgcQ family protein [bacterium]